MKADVLCVIPVVYNIQYSWIKQELFQQVFYRHVFVAEKLIRWTIDFQKYDKV